jgi:ketosteroid isomerase-like protein
MSLEERVARLEAMLELMTLEAEYARAWDTGDADGWAGVFTHDGVFELVGSAGRPTRTYEGQAALREFCQTVNAEWTGLHLMHVPQLMVDGDVARGRVHFEWTSVARGHAAHTVQGRTYGYYDILYRRTGEGWRMARRVEHGVGRAQTVFDTV